MQGNLTSDVAAVSSSYGLHVFARQSDGQLWTRLLSGGAWSPWTALGGSPRATPTAVATAERRLRVHPQRRRRDLDAALHRRVGRLGDHGRAVDRRSLVGRRRRQQRLPGRTRHQRRDLLQPVGQRELDRMAEPRRQHQRRHRWSCRPPTSCRCSCAAATTRSGTGATRRRAGRASRRWAATSPRRTRSSRDPTRRTGRGGDRRARGVARDPGRRGRHDLAGLAAGQRHARPCSPRPASRCVGAVGARSTAGSRCCCTTAPRSPVRIDLVTGVATSTDGGAAVRARERQGLPAGRSRPTSSRWPSVKFRAQVGGAGRHDHGQGRAARRCRRPARARVALGRRPRALGPDDRCRSRRPCGPRSRNATTYWTAQLPEGRGDVLRRGRRRRRTFAIGPSLDPPDRSRGRHASATVPLIVALPDVPGRRPSVLTFAAWRSSSGSSWSGS